MTDILDYITPDTQFTWNIEFREYTVYVERLEDISIFGSPRRITGYELYGMLRSNYSTDVEMARLDIGKFFVRFSTRIIVPNIGYQYIDEFLSISMHQFGIFLSFVSQNCSGIKDTVEDNINWKKEGF